MIKRYLIAIAIVVLSIFNYAIYNNEELITNGKTILLKLAPVDPRSLMQGDYMRLNFKINQELWAKLWKIRGKKSMYIDNGSGKIIVKLDKNRVAKFVDIYKNQTLQKDNILLRYKARDNRVILATNAFFFQEGKAKLYEKAKYGEFKVDKNGKMLLVNMVDKDFKRIK